MTTPDGASGRLDETAWLIDRAELDDAIVTKTLKHRLETELKKCADEKAAAEAKVAPTQTKTGLIVGVWSVTVVGAFIGGAVVFSQIK